MPAVTTRRWWRNEYYDHPGRLTKQEDAYVVGGNTKVEKVYCMPCFNGHVAEIIARDEADLYLGRRNIVRTREEVVTHGMSFHMFRRYLTNNRLASSVVDTERSPALARQRIWIPTLR